MITMILILVFLICAAACWWQGLWSSLIVLLEVLISGLVAISYYELLSYTLYARVNRGYVHLWDFIALWSLFCVTCGVLRVGADFLSRHQVEFHFWVEMAGRTLVSLWVAWLMVGFTAVTLHTAPLPSRLMEPALQGRTFLGLAPDRQWLALVQSRSRGALRRPDPAGRVRSPYSEDQGWRVFDPQSLFIHKYYARRRELDQLPGFVR